MVGPGEVDDELHAETQEECAKHGPVKELLIFEAPDDGGGGGRRAEEEGRVRIFVAFERQESAVRAYVAMNGRFFGGRQVQASFFDEARFAQRDLAPRPGE
jgi:splicing factor 45